MKRFLIIFTALFVLASCKTTGTSSAYNPVFAEWSKFELNETTKVYKHTQTGFELPPAIGSWQRQGAPTQTDKGNFAETVFTSANMNAVLMVQKPLPPQLMKNALMIKLNSQVKIIKASNKALTYHYLANYKNSADHELLYGPSIGYKNTNNEKNGEVAVSLVTTKGFFALRISYNDLTHEEADGKIKELVEFLAGDKVILHKYS